jgi:hypothetical protein
LDRRVGDSELVDRWQRIWDEPVPGWDFSSFGGRIEEEPLSWSYADLARGLLPGAHAVLDIGTGGGELLVFTQHRYLLGARQGGKSLTFPTGSPAGEV